MFGALPADYGTHYGTHYGSYGAYGGNKAKQRVNDPKIAAIDVKIKLLRVSGRWKNRKAIRKLLKERKQLVATYKARRLEERIARRVGKKATKAEKKAAKEAEKAAVDAEDEAYIDPEIEAIAAEEGESLVPTDEEVEAQSGMSTTTKLAIGGGVVLTLLGVGYVLMRR